MKNPRSGVARVGLLAVGLRSYWDQFPGMKDGILAFHGRLAGILGAKAEVIHAGLVDSVVVARRAADLFSAGHVDMVFCHLTTYANSETLLPAVSGLDVPVVLLNVQPVRTLDMSEVKGIADWLGVACTCAALPEMTAILIRAGKRFAVVSGHLDNDEILEQRLSEWCAIAGLRRVMSGKSAALIGRPFAGMLDLNVDETNLFNVFGTYTQHFDWDDVIAELDAVTDKQISAAAADLDRLFVRSPSVSEEELQSLAGICAAFRRFVVRHELCLVASHYEGEPSDRHTGLLAALNPALSLLMADGVACPVEGDIKAGLAMLILKRLAGSATLAELYSMDFEDDICIIGHSGAGDPSISGEPPTLSYSTVFHGKSGGGYLTQFYPKLGPATLLAVTQDASGGYRMIAAECHLEQGPTLNLGDTNSRVRFSCDLRNFIEQWSELGPTHHAVLGPGHHVQTLKRASTALGIPLEVVAR